MEASSEAGVHATCCIKAQSNSPAELLGMYRQPNPPDT